MIINIVIITYENMNKIIFISIEVQKRELMSKLYLAYLLVKRGYKVVLGDYVRIHHYALTQNNGIFMDSHFFGWTREYEKMKNRGFVFIFSDEEALIAGGKEAYIKQRVDDDNLKMADAVLTWGVEHKQNMESTLVEKNKIHMVGNPRMDLLRKDMRGLWKSEIEQYEKKYGKYILVNTSFSYATQENAYENEKRNLEQMLHRADAGIKVLKEQVDQFKNTYIKFVEGIKYLAENVKETIVVRPHPNEDIMIYKEHFKIYKNVHVICNGDVNAWIMGAKVVIHNSCTTGVESFVSEIPIIAYEPDGLVCFENAISNVLSLEVRSKAELVKEVEWLYSRRTEKEIREKYFGDSKYEKLREHVWVDPQEKSVEKIASVIDTFKVQGEIKVSTWDKIIFTAKDYAHYILRKKNKDYKWTDINCRVLKRKLKKIENAIQDNTQIEVLPLKYRIYLLEREN